MKHRCSVLLLLAGPVAPFSTSRMAPPVPKSTPAPAPGWPHSSPPSRLGRRLGSSSSSSSSTAGDEPDELPFTELNISSKVAAHAAAAAEEEAREAAEAAAEAEFLAAGLSSPDDDAAAASPPADGAYGSQPSPPSSPTPGGGDGGVAAAGLELGGKGERLDEWEELGGNFVLRPPPQVPVRAVVHFLGGAFVGAAPHITYRYLLSGLAANGYLVVATPFNLGFDYLEVCDRVLETFEAAAVPLAREYGAVPVVGLGHSCGALLQVLITSLFPATPRAANALLSFNNKPLADAVPGFEALFQPLAAAAMGDPSADPAGLKRLLATVREAVGEGLDSLVESTQPGAAEAAAGGGLGGGGRDPLVEAAVAVAALSGPAAQALGTNLVGLDPSFVAKRAADLKGSLAVIDQIPSLFADIAAGTTEFSPSPEDTCAACKRMYRARRTLLVEFENDPIDETPKLFAAITEAQETMRLKRPMVTFNIRREAITGDHVTPLTQDVFVPTSLDAAVPLRGSARAHFLKTVDGTQRVLLDWLAEV